MTKYTQNAEGVLKNEKTVANIQKSLRGLEDPKNADKIGLRKVLQNATPAADAKSSNDPVNPLRKQLASNRALNRQLIKGRAQRKSVIAFFRLAMYLTAVTVLSAIIATKIVMPFYAMSIMPAVLPTILVSLLAICLIGFVIHSCSSVMHYNKASDILKDDTGIMGTWNADVSKDVQKREGKFADTDPLAFFAVLKEKESFNGKSGDMIRSLLGLLMVVPIVVAMVTIPGLLVNPLMITMLVATSLAAVANIFEAYQECTWFKSMAGQDQPSKDLLIKEVNSSNIKTSDKISEEARDILNRAVKDEDSVHTPLSLMSDIKVINYGLSAEVAK
ncbi:MAG: hypothetical protein P857_846 [Candidatus Xenolissoclinum pacificiensis L6]|uniref:Uncharacterized protein n=1 Tax=Candidatus Xenolissoclinum pacificiensis L6 TaxID=1401685 RepID=W2UZT1_9RICK|nr:MAG: hypothetical protein P857_846 [Candidatus Xenolissoclinum pacificiensis L6]